MSKTALILASLAVVFGAAIANSKTPAAGSCPSISILADATRLTVLQSGKIDLKAEIRTPELGCTVNGVTREKIVALGETRSPGIADLFVTTMKGTYA